MDVFHELLNTNNLPAGSFVMLCADNTYTAVVQAAGGQYVCSANHADPLKATRAAIVEYLRIKEEARQEREKG